MALLMEKGSQPQTESEKADLDAIAALKESAAIELKEKGNECVKKGKKHFSEAIDCYTRAINQQALNDSDTSILFSNRAHVNLLLGNYRRALTDAEEAIKLCPTNLKALYRAAKASFSLNLLPESTSHCENGLKHDPGNEELKKLLRQIESKKMEHEQREAQVSKAIAEAKDLVSAIENRRMKLGKAMYRELTGLRKPVLDKNNMLHWPVLLLYAEVMSSDFIEDFCETDMLSAHLEMCILWFPELSNMFSDSCPPLSWDQEHNYTRDAIELYYEFLCQRQFLRCLLEGTPASNVESISDEQKDANENSIGSSSAENTLYDVLREPNLIIPRIPGQHFFGLNKFPSQSFDYGYFLYQWSFAICSCWDHKWVPLLNEPNSSRT
ncbi:tetratricopeptide repeat protein 4-like protein [Pyrus ussuriensis x Pyrus communis]|uniref:Tetratricopeptide repeat protein 4-like protein n=1 Tax=Pyrus ussuriensis x Pyrus communis TaxID=2448454 RepID=A0A5N5GXP2_9ROSA|nr:tetratricopeptide repeat protein 4-like protein [Pyrus ussuriensis x Pyrus communis]